VNIRIQNDAISVAQTNDGYLGIVTENLQRMSEILVQVPAGNQETAALIAENTRITGLTGTSLTGTISSVAADLTAVGTARAVFGAAMATAASQVASLQIGSVNLSAAYSRIMDTDYASETTSMTRNNILQQAGTAVLAQANQTPNTVLTLLR
jgi:flagellin